MRVARSGTELLAVCVQQVGGRRSHVEVDIGLSVQPTQKTLFVLSWIACRRYCTHRRLQRGGDELGSTPALQAGGVARPEGYPYASVRFGDPGGAEADVVARHLMGYWVDAIDLPASCVRDPQRIGSGRDKHLVHAGVELVEPATRIFHRAWPAFATLAA